MALPPEARLAQSVLGGYLRVRPGESVTVETWSPALPWARAFVLESRRLRAETTLVVEDEETFFRSLAGGVPVPVAPLAFARRPGAYVYLVGPDAYARLLGLPREERATTWRRHGSTWTAAASRRGLRAARVLLTAAGEIAASRYGVELDSWRRELLAASLVPPRTLASRAGVALQRLSRARHVRVRHSNGTDLTMQVRGSAWVEETGDAARPGRRADPVWVEIPTGRLVVPVIPRTVSGRWEANRPTYDRFAEVPVDVGGRFAFRDGSVRDVAFERGGERILGVSERRLRRSRPVVALSFGLNPKVSRAPEVGDLALGTVGLRLGAPFDGTPQRPGAPGYVSLLREADVELDGAPWLSGSRFARRRPA